MTLLTVISLQMFQNKMKISPLVITSNFPTDLKKGFLICNDKSISDNDKYEEGSIEWWELNCFSRSLYLNGINIMTREKKKKMKTLSLK